MATGAQVQAGLQGNQFAPGIGDISAFDFDGDTYFFAAERNGFTFLNDSFQELSDRFFSGPLTGIVTAPLDAAQFTAISTALPQALALMRS